MKRFWDMGVRWSPASFMDILSRVVHYLVVTLAVVGSICCLLLVLLLNSVIRLADMQGLATITCQYLTGLLGDIYDVKAAILTVASWMFSSTRIQPLLIFLAGMFGGFWCRYPVVVNDKLVGVVHPATSLDALARLQELLMNKLKGETKNDVDSM